MAVATIQRVMVAMITQDLPVKILGIGIALAARVLPVVSVQELGLRRGSTRRVELHHRSAGDDLDVFGKEHAVILQIFGKSP